MILQSITISVNYTNQIAVVMDKRSVFYVARIEHNILFSSLTWDSKDNAVFSTAVYVLSLVQKHCV